MKIVSKFKDYYDCGVAFGIDPKIKYNRLQNTDPILIPVPKALPTFSRNTWWREDRLWDTYKDKKFPPPASGLVKDRSYWLFFCGNIYKFSCIYSEYFHEGKFRTYRVSTMHEQWEEYHCVYEAGYRELANQVVGTPTDVNTTLDCPIVIGWERDHGFNRGQLEILLNPCLKEYGVHGKYGFPDPFWVFNEISMWLGKKNQEGRDAVQPLTEQQKVEQHGFHYKSSFRHRKD